MGWGVGNQNPADLHGVVGRASTRVSSKPDVPDASLGDDNGKAFASSYCFLFKAPRLAKWSVAEFWVKIRWSETVPETQYYKILGLAQYLKRMLLPVSAWSSANTLLAFVPHPRNPFTDEIKT